MRSLKVLYKANFYLRNKAKLGFSRPSIGMNFVSYRHFEPLYSVHPDNFVISEGDEVVFSIKTTNLKDNTRLFYTIIGCEAADFTDNLLSGECYVMSNTATFTKRITNDNLTEGPQSFIIQLHRHSPTGPIVRNSSILTIADTSIGEDLVLSFNSDNVSKFVYDGTVIENNHAVIALNGISVTKYLYHNSAYIYLPPNSTAQFNTPSNLPDSTDGQFGIFDVYVEKANGSLVSLVQMHHPMYQHAYYWLYRTYSTVSAAVSNLTPKGFSFNLTRTGNNVVASITYNTGGSVTSTAYPLADGDRVKLTHSANARPNYVYPSGIPLYGFDEAAFPTNGYKTITTTEQSQFIMTNDLVISAVNFGYSLPSSTEIKILVSFDNRTTWKKWDGAEFIEAVDISLGNTVSEITSGLVGLNVNSSTTIDFKIGFKTTSTVVTPFITDISFSLVSF